MNASEQQLKDALVAAMPLLFFSEREFGKYTILRWRHSRQIVTPHEWLDIARMVFIEWLKKGGRHVVQYKYFSLSVSWQDAAEYLVEIGAITISES